MKLIIQIISPGKFCSDFNTFDKGSNISVLFITLTGSRDPYFATSIYLHRNGDLLAH